MPEYIFRQTVDFFTKNGYYIGSHFYCTEEHMRLNKYLADCGVASRRACDKLIAEGAVRVNGKPATLGTDVNEANDSVTVNGRRVTLAKKHYYLMLHKPKGYVTTVSDELGRKTVMDLVNIKARVYPVGRLDYDTEGLLLLTSDGQLSNALTRPSSEVPKTYIARVSGQLSDADINRLRNGVMIDGKQTLPAIVGVAEKDAHHTRLQITITEGRNRQIKKMLEAVGSEVEFLKRVSIGDLRLGGLSRGKYRFLTDREVQYLKSLGGIK